MFSNTRNNINIIINDMASIAACKASNKNIQYDTSEVQWEKCIHQFANCIKLQCELNEVSLELKSVIKIVNILNRDLALINEHTHNLHKQAASPSTAQPFENWPLRHTTKKSYC
jgi:hypothetical protein